jgi:hypothetical protein
VKSLTGARYTLSTGLQIIDQTPPETLITAGPQEGEIITGRDVTFTWSGTDNTGGALTFSNHLDGEPVSVFSAATGRSLTGLSLGNHTFEVVATDSSGNIDPTPAVRHFQITDTTFTFDTSTTLATYSEGATAQFVAYAFNSSNPTQPLTSATVSVRLTIKNSLSVVVFGPSLLAFNPANAQFLSNFNTAGLAPGTYTAVFEFFDSASNLIGATQKTFDVTRSFTVAIATDRADYDRGQSVTLSGTVLDELGNPLSAVAVTLAVKARGFSREFLAFTNLSGSYQFIFNPDANEAGRYVAEARVTRNGITKLASVPFTIHGFLLTPALVSVSMSMNSSLNVPLAVQNIGETDLTGITFSAQDPNQSDGINASINLNGFSGSLSPGASKQISVLVTAPTGTPPIDPATFTVLGSTAQAVSETSSVRISLREARGIPVIEPTPEPVGMKPGDSRALNFLVRNEGFATMANARIQVRDPNTFNWIVLQDSTFGDLAPGQSRNFAVNLFPPSNLPLGNYVAQLDLVTTAETFPIFIEIEITSSVAHPVVFRVADDTGANVAGASVTLVSKTLYQRVLPSGTETFNKIFQGISDTSGNLTLPQVDAGNYDVQILADRHAPYQAPITVEPGTQVDQFDVFLVTKVVDFVFTVVPTTIADQYDVSLVVTYSTDLIKPALVASPPRLDLSFFPEETNDGWITITNSHTLTKVTNVVIDASRIDPITKQLQILFSNNQSTLFIDEILAKETKTIPFKAILPQGADLTSRSLGNINISGKYIFSARGQALQGTTDSPIFAFFNKPESLRLMPPVSFLNDETDGIAGNLKYQGTTTQITIQNQRTLPIDFLTFGGAPTTVPPVQAISLGVPQNTPLDNVPRDLVAGANVFWTGQLTANRLESRGESVNFDVSNGTSGGMPKALQNALEDNYAQVVNNPVYLGVVGRWGDSGTSQGFIFPVSITTIRPQQVVIFSGGAGFASTFAGGGGGPLPVSFNNHGQVKIQIDQSVSLEREAFNATLNITPAVASVDGFNAMISIKDSNGLDATDKFVVTSTKTPPSPIIGASSAAWLIIPKVAAGGTLPEGLQYTVGARLSYSVAGVPFTFDVVPQIITVKPLPRLQLEYTVPFVVMRNIPFRLDVKASNVGDGAANGLKIASAQPRIVENANNIPISFSIDGSSSTGNEANFQLENLTIEFPTVPAKSSANGFWRMHTTRRGFFIDFTSTLTHRSFNGKDLDPLIEQVKVGFVPAVGGNLTRTCDRGLLLVRLRGTTLQTTTTTNGDYYIPNVPAGNYLMDVLQNGTLLGTQPINVLADQPTDFIDLFADNSFVDTDRDGMPDCYEVANGFNPDDSSDASQHADTDGLMNLQEFQLGTDPRKTDTDSDGVDDGTEVAQQTNPLDAFDIGTPTFTRAAALDLASGHA